MTEVRGTFDARGRQFAVVAASFNDLVVSRLVEGAWRVSRPTAWRTRTSWSCGCPALELPWPPSAWPPGRYDAIVCLGAVVRGETPHFDLVAGQAARVARVALDSGLPVLFGVLTTDTMAQALDRAGGKHGNKGWDAAMAAMQTCSALDAIPTKE